MSRITPQNLALINLGLEQGLQPQEAQRSGTPKSLQTLAPNPGVESLLETLLSQERPSFLDFQGIGGGSSNLPRFGGGGGGLGSRDIMSLIQEGTGAGPGLPRRRVGGPNFTLPGGGFTEENRSLFPELTDEEFANLIGIGGGE